MYCTKGYITISDENKTKKNKQKNSITEEARGKQAI
jgi:hypothetical protein